MSAFRRRRFLGAGLCGLALLAASAGRAAAAFEARIPASDAEVVARVRPGKLPARERELREERRALERDPRNLGIAVRVASKMIELGRSEADPRWLGRAETALGPWWSEAGPPVEVLMLRATIRQSLHEFPAALADLDAALARDPHNAQAWLTKASVLTVRGDYAEARRACLPLMRLTDGLVATVASASVASLTGRAARSVELVEAALASRPEAPDAIRVWAMTQLAETSERLGRAAEAERHYQAALALAPRDPYLVGAYADFLLDRGRPAEAASLVRDYSRIDGLLLRLAEAHAALPAETTAAARETADLDTRFAAARERGDRVHLREEARFRLRLQRMSAAALALARENWDVQKEPADLRILMEAARAAGDRAVESEASAWAARTGLEDIRLARSILAATHP